VLLAILFAATFAVLGVGSGQGGLDQLFNNIFGGGGGTSLSSLQHKVQKEPGNAKAWNDLALKYGEKQRTSDAIGAMTHYTGLRPKDASGFSQLAQFQLQQAQSQTTDWQLAQSLANVWASAGYRPVVTTGKLAKGLGTDPFVQAVQTQGSTAQSAASVKRATAQQSYTTALATLQKVAKLQPQSADAQLQIAGAADAALNGLQDTAFAATEVNAYKRLEQLDPPNKAQYAQRVKQLKPFLPAAHR
jgi:hypothetical protein